ncbi:MAG: hypothetical protein R6V22_00980 [Rhodohalobacter sp.]|uniref:hypothetical protein n=1 Tax=Rhodohalobacter sp. TaxID=1974210 RepID=UPI003974F0BE
MAKSISVENFDGEKWFKISNHDRLRPFFMSVVSDSNHWMFISSNGGLTAGRKNSEYALFPYYTDDKITDLADTTGSKTIIQVKGKEYTRLWEPFSDRFADNYSISRNLYKNRFGNKILFEEINHDLNLTFRYQWNSSNEFGFVRKSELINHSDRDYSLSFIDGIQNVLPYGVESDMQRASSNLADAYKRTELIKDSGLAIFALSAIIVDKAEPSEALKANIAWSYGLENPNHLLSSLQLNKFRKKEKIREEKDVKGEKGAYFLHTEIDLPASETKEWKIVANVNQNQSQVVELDKAIQQDQSLNKKLEQNVEKGTKQLLQLTGSADGLQKTSDNLKDARHYSNVLFNIMRGGIFDDNYNIEKSDFISYLKSANQEVFNRNKDFINSLAKVFKSTELYKQLEDKDDQDLLRLSKEYLPLKFSRRHGDPSRPWNQFSINTHSELDGSKILDYEGNWRDIFQNWEALVHSYPGFIEGMIFKFLNATTFDGYNPYRVTKGGFDWETIDPDDPWSYIGYWGDHQIIYLLKFLEFYKNLQPDALEQLFNKECFTYANVPYRIKSYEQIAKDPKNTIDFDEKTDQEIREKVEAIGADGALLQSEQSDIHRVNFIEKILAAVLAKMSNFIPEGGIWMNTQRPEWNDANNALVGNGVSMVTLYYLRRFLKFFEDTLSETETDDLVISEELNLFFTQISDALQQHKDLLNKRFNDAHRKDVTDALGTAGSKYRNEIYENGFSGEKETLKIADISEFLNTALSYLEHSIEANRRDDRLYHAYNLMSMNADGVSLSRLDEMLEGQVAVLSSGYLSPKESADVLDALRNSSLYREDQNSYILYPNKDLPGFLEKNNVPESLVEKSELLKKMIADGNRQIINRDVEGNYHFNGNFRNAGDLKEALHELKSTKYQPLVEKEFDLLLQIFEEVFNHKAFTGRSGTFFAFEGLGSIYWHMVSKLYLAVEEVTLDAYQKDADASVLNRLKNHFYEVGDGIGIHKSPEDYGAFPTDPYSHTPYHRGAQQPGMTGQVKEDILVRIGELGVFIKDGIISFNPLLLKKDELLKEASEFKYVDVQKEDRKVSLQPKSLSFTFCQVPVVYQQTDEDKIEVKLNNGATREFNSLNLDKNTSEKVFNRTGEIELITVYLKSDRLT